MKKILVTLATLAVSAGIALAGAGSAQANDDPGLCWNGCVLGRLRVGTGLGRLEPVEQLESWTWALGCSSRREALEVARAAPGSPALRPRPW